MSKPVFFNLFAAAEPGTSVKVTHGTPCIDPCVQRRTRGRSYTHCRQSPMGMTKQAKMTNY